MKRESFGFSCLVVCCNVLFNTYLYINKILNIANALNYCLSYCKKLFYACLNKCLRKSMLLTESMHMKFYVNKLHKQVFVYLN